MARNRWHRRRLDCVDISRMVHRPVRLLRCVVLLRMLQLLQVVLPYREEQASQAVAVE